LILWLIPPSLGSSTASTSLGAKASSTRVRTSSRAEPFCRCRRQLGLRKVLSDQRRAASEARESRRSSLDVGRDTPGRHLAPQGIGGGLGSSLGRDRGSVGSLG